MSEKKEPAADRLDPERMAFRKKPYQKPAFRSEGVFETQALVCGKINTTQPQCRFQSKTS